MSEDTFDARGMIQMGVVRGIDDTGSAQLVTVETSEGFVYDRVMVMQPAGFASVPASDGSIVLLLAVGGDPGNWRALPVANPSRRFGALAPGEAVVYGTLDGSRVAIRAGGTVEVQAATTIIITAPGATIQADNVTFTSAGAVNLAAPGGVIITGNVEVDGEIHATGVITGA